LIGLKNGNDSLEELGSLACTAGITVLDRIVQPLSQPHPTSYIGSGKAAELAERIREEEKNLTLIFDDELSPVQQRTLERLFGENTKILDRTALILDIFAQHAHTREGQIQVELAQYEYRLPRLTRLWTHLVRQAGGRAGGAIGGVGLRGPGETQLEVDRRQIRRRISSLRRELDSVRRHRQLQSRHRRKKGIRTMTLVGYTNAGKSSLLNALSARYGQQPGNVLVADQLFATLDPVSRQLRLPAGTRIVATDTVGFINKLPHHLVAAFRATLEGIEEADLLLHVADVSQDAFQEQIRTVNGVLSDLDLAAIPTLLVKNKIDLLPAAEKRNLQRDPGMVSARTGRGLDALMGKIEQVLKEDLIALDVEIPYTEGQLKNIVFELGTVERMQEGQTGTHLVARVPPALAAKLAPYRKSAD